MSAWQPWLSPKVAQVGNFQASVKEVALTRGTRQKVSRRHPPGPRFSVLMNPWLLPRSPSHNKRFRRVAAAAAKHPESLGATVIGCPGRGREEDQALRVPPPPTVLSPHPSNTWDEREWPPGGQDGSATLGSWEEASWQRLCPGFGAGAGQDWVVS